jgi:hypothetical protein
VYWLIILWLPRVIGAGVSVNGSTLVFCGRDMWFVGGRNVCAIIVYLQFWCVNPLHDKLHKQFTKYYLKFYLTEK